jgi:hypothetical protein
MRIATELPDLKLLAVYSLPITASVYTRRIYS